MVKGLLISKRLLICTGIGLLIAMVLAPVGLAQDIEFGEEAIITEEEAVPVSIGEAIRVLGLALGAAGAIGLSALATARSQAAIGAGGTGAMAEKPELFSRVFILVALPETMVVLGFVLGIVIALNI